MNIIASLLKRFALYLVCFLCGVIGGIYVHDRLSKPKIVYETVIEKQKVKGKGNDGKFNNEITIQNNEQEKTKKRGFIGRLFRRRKGDHSDTTDVDAVD